MAFFLAAETDDLVAPCDEDFTPEMVAELVEQLPMLIGFEA